jgi:hypothetical protein
VVGRKRWKKGEGSVFTSYQFLLQLASPDGKNNKKKAKKTKKAD